LASSKTRKQEVDHDERTTIPSQRERSEQFRSNTLHAQ